MLNHGNSGRSFESRKRIGGLLIPVHPSFANYRLEPVKTRNIKKFSLVFGVNLVHLQNTDTRNSIMKAIDVAKYLIAKSDSAGDPITNKKLQKLLYYVKAWGLVYFKDGVIDEPFEAWVHGPVCPVIYQQFKQFGYNPVSIEYNGEDPDSFVRKFWKEHESEKDKIELIDAVFRKYEGFTSFQLEMLSHQSKPWIEAREGLSPIENGNKVISDSSMKEYYSSLIKR